MLGAATADDALDATGRFHPKILIVDFALPQRPGAELADGADVIAHLQTDALIHQIHCRMVTGYEPAEVRERMALLRLTPEIWQKPVEGERLLARLEEILHLPVPASASRRIS